MKRAFQLAVGLAYLTAIFFSGLMSLKPGAALFYAKSTISTQALTRDGNAYEYLFSVNKRIYNPGTLLLYEDRQVFDLAMGDDGQPAGSGTYTIKEAGEKQLAIRLIPTNPSIGATDEHTYSIYIRPFLISSEWGSRAFLVLSLGLAAFFGSILLAPQKRAVLLGSPAGIIRLWFALFDRPAGASSQASRPFPLSRAFLLKSAAANIVLIAFFYVFMEWLFQATRPSFMDILSMGQKLNIFMNAGLAAALIALVILPFILLLDLLLSPIFPSFRKYAYHFPPALLGAGIALILIDNFTYTILKFGIVNSKTVVRALYAVLFAGVLVYLLHDFTASKRSARQPAANKFGNISAVTVFSVSCILAIFTFRPENKSPLLDGQISTGNGTPNIILLSSDGLDAASMSVYGYERNTTPFMSELAKSSLISLNNFTNSSHSMGSDTALLTSKLPFETRVLFPPDTLKGTDKYQHLPGILQRAGYRTVSLGVPYYVDANTINFQNAFDAVNCKEGDAADTIASWLSGYGYDDAIYLLAIIVDRITDRLQHIFLIQEMPDPFADVKQAQSDWLTDRQRLQCLYAYLAEAKQTGQPLFAHVHLMGTHHYGSKFYPSMQVFSKGKEQDQLWMADFYDDTILDFDREVHALVAYLKDHSMYDRTILVLHTDHANKNITDKRLPLIIHFPNDLHAGIISTNTQNLDIAPTLLDYLGIQEPAWMNGSSLLREMDPGRLILAGIAHKMVEDSQGNAFLSPEAFTPPFYQFGTMTVIQCQKVYAYNLVELTVQVREVAGYPSPCPAEMLDSPEVIHNKVGSLLARYGFQLPENW